MFVDISIFPSHNRRTKTTVQFFQASYETTPILCETLTPNNNIKKDPFDGYLRLMIRKNMVIVRLRESIGRGGREEALGVGPYLFQADIQQVVGIQIQTLNLSEHRKNFIRENWFKFHLSSGAPSF